MIQEKTGPVRTCIGCRKSGSISELFRVVVNAAHSDMSDESVPQSSATFVVADERQRMVGRGAWLHFSIKCFDNAQRKHAFSRALKVQGEINLSGVQEFLNSSTSEP